VSELAAPWVIPPWSKLANRTPAHPFGMRRCRRCWRACRHASNYLTVPRNNATTMARIVGAAPT
jgi:hypothetical protein